MEQLQPWQPAPVEPKCQPAGPEPATEKSLGLFEALRGATSWQLAPVKPNVPMSRSRTSKREELGPTSGLRGATSTLAVGPVEVKVPTCTSKREDPGLT